MVLLKNNVDWISDGGTYDRFCKTQTAPVINGLVAELLFYRALPSGIML